MTKSHRHRLLICVLILGFHATLLVGCASGAPTILPPTATMRASATPPATSTPPSTSLAALPSATASLTASPTVVATPTDTPLPTAPPTACPTPTPSPPPVYGIEMMSISPKRGLALAQTAGVYWLRVNGLRWADVEATPGVRDWSKAAGLEKQLATAHEAGLQTILVVRRTPAWAQSVPGVYCGPVAPEALEGMAEFMAEAVTRYRDPPFSVKYWELGNEPDVAPGLVAPDAPFGCWGNAQDPYYGGAYYARMLQAVVPAIKAADPEAQVLLGGLLLDADPAHDPHENPPGRFLEGVLQGGGGDFFDIVSFHSYARYHGEVLDWEMMPAGWRERGGSFVGKVDFLREVLAAYGYDRPLMLTETGLLCVDCPSPAPAEFLEAQAAYLPRVYVRSMALDLAATVWYTFDGPGWRQTGLLDETQQPRPAYDALATMRRLLHGTRYSGPVTEFDSVEGYAFERAGEAGTIWVLWSPEDATVRIPIPDTLEHAYNEMGVELEPQEGFLGVGFSPTYLQMTPKP